MIIALHGFGSTAEVSSSVKAIRGLFPDEDVVGVTYDYLNPEFVEQQILTAIDADADELIFIGVSLGGFWARYMANKFTGSQLIMVNPSIDAHVNITKRHGTEVNGRIVPNDLGPRMAPYFIEEDVDGLPISVVVGMVDDVVDPTRTVDVYTNRAGVLKVEDAGHRIAIEGNVAEFIELAVYTMCE